MRVVVSDEKKRFKFSRCFALKNKLYYSVYNTATPPQESKAARIERIEMDSPFEMYVRGSAYRGPMLVRVKQIPSSILKRA